MVCSDVIARGHTHTHTHTHTQVLQVAVNKSDIDNDNPPEFFVNWGGRTSNILSVLDLETNPGEHDN